MQSSSLSNPLKRVKDGERKLQSPDAKRIGTNSSQREALANELIELERCGLKVIQCLVHYKIYTSLPTFLVFFLSICELTDCKSKVMLHIKQPT